MRARLAVLSAALLALSCATRDRSNPFDPANRGTLGRPVGFAAIAGDHEARLQWTRVTGDGLVGYQVFRRTATQTDFTPLSIVLPPGTASFVDRGLLDGLDHYYRLYYVFTSGLDTRPAEDVATPGPQRTWVADYGTGRVSRLSADGRHVARVRLVLRNGATASASAFWLVDTTAPSAPAALGGSDAWTAEHTRAVSHGASADPFPGSGIARGSRSARAPAGPEAEEGGAACIVSAPIKRPCGFPARPPPRARPCSRSAARWKTGS